MNSYTGSSRHQLSTLVGIGMVLVAIFAAPADASLRLGYTAAENAETLACLNLAENGAAPAGADAAQPARKGRILVGLGFGVHTSGEPQSMWTPNLWIYYTRPISAGLVLELLGSSWYTGGRFHAALETAPDVFADAKWGWRVELSGIPLKISDEIYFGGDRVTSEMLGWGENNLIVSLYAATPGLPAAKLGVYYMGGYRYFNDIDETALDYAVPSDTIKHTGGLFWDWNQLGEPDALRQYNRVGAHRVYADAHVTHRQDWAPWGVPGAVRSTDDTYFKGHVAWFAVAPGVRDVDRTVFQVKGGTGTGLDRWSAFWIGSALFSNPMVDFRRPNAEVRGFLHRQFRAESYASVNLAYRLQLADNVRATLNLDYAWFDQLSAQTVGAGGSANALGVGFGVAAGLGDGAVLRFDYGVGVLGPESGDTGIHEFRLSVLKEF